MDNGQEKTLNWIRNIFIIIVLGIGFWMYAEVPHNLHYSTERGFSFIENSTKYESLVEKYWDQWDRVNQSYTEYIAALDDYNKEIDYYNKLREEYNKHYLEKRFHYQPRHVIKEAKEDWEEGRAQWDICLQKEGRVEQLKEIYLREEKKLQNISDQIDKLEISRREG